MATPIAIKPRSNVCTEKGKRAHYRLIVWQCFIIFSQGATGIVQAMTLSFGGLQFSAGHFEFAANPASLHTTITFRRIHLYEDMDIFLSVTVNEDNGHAEKLIVKPVKGGKTPLYACEAGCQYDPVEVGYKALLLYVLIVLVIKLICGVHFA